MSKKENKYSSLEQLEANEKVNIDYKIYSRDGLSDIAIIAIHGGGIEPGTTKIADEIAGKEHSFYSFNGIKGTDNFDLHLDSRVFNEPKCVEIVKKSGKVISIHGSDKKNEKVEAIFLGGLDDNLKNKIQKYLTSAGFAVEKTPPDLLGRDKDNICNQGKTKIGVQIEIQSALRSGMFDSDHKTRTRRTTPNARFYKLVSAIREAIIE